ncbi:TetR family transcriptional regulator [Nocardia abscessus]|uniref:TetR/AcrR family transcriptional regulator n=1 Tax=Nocardia TaxID=1817 RepID=UPI0018947478|nr:MULTISPECIES: TetR family transcriptional regulator [Nocardia]MBF6221204.1 TetR family transcriptional regulator [Nocardia abscessus]MDE1671282.1 TetR family transcriptional regulator [Nocardia gipuzkoensis]
MSTKRELVLDAAIELLGSRGTRALTHRAVDEVACMPAGSASNYFRTREALLIGIAERLEARDYADWEALNRQPSPGTITELVDGMAAFVVHAARTDRVRTLARYALFLEAQTMPALRETVRRGHRRLTEWAAGLLAEVGGDPAMTQILVGQFDGIILHQLVNPAPDFDPRPALDRLVRALLASNS